jgi:serine beta-lactamase-like protein LACTB, mitochondrial
MKINLLIFLLIWISTPSKSQHIDKKTIELTRNMANELLRTSNMPGISIAISKKGKIVFDEGFGFADIANKIPVTKATEFRTASVAKIITATAIGKLVQDGKLNLDLPIQEYVPQFPQKKFIITSRQLAGHLSGLPNYSDNDKIENRVYSSVQDALGVFSHDSLLFEPETNYHYSTHGFTLISAVIEGASGKNFLDYIDSQIFKPLRMNNTGPDRRTQKTKTNAAKLYKVEKGIQEEVKTPEEVSYKWAGGGLITTPTDLIRLANGYFNGFLSPDIVKMMFESQSVKSGEKTQVGIGWRISQDIDGRRVIEHAGSMQGARSVICIYPDEQLVISMMVNAEWSSTIEETVHMMARPFLTKKTPKSFPIGDFNVLTTSVNVRGKETNAKAKLRLNAKEGVIIYETGQQIPIIYLDENNIFALIRPDGIYYLTIDFNGQTVAGKAIGYGSQLSNCPISNPPFFKFATSN